MQTYTESKLFVNNPDFQYQREQSLEKLDLDLIDKPIVELIQDFAKLEYCFTLQCCYGHFVFKNQKDKHNLDPLPSSYIAGRIEYRIAYIAICIDNNENGKILLKKLGTTPSIDENYVQFGCADWFWDQQVNSFVLQVEPDRFKYEDKAVVSYEEALHLEKIRNHFFIRLNNIISSLD